ncbi:hypothetical protein P691DRAFT_668881 [Macrolepiota fuliginosa MF-IS2]|uniref:BTB domain-containing protein n=1 Tax=Macrolepiota fuliginosa MF-IS2 TaxID=1400762 RepID=A0A9P5XEK7_9AGAR|nr:hypothetical protein P691DRAFT_668881 [Macrolepiota fuliginosa MF-IS2]
MADKSSQVDILTSIDTPLGGDDIRKVGAGLDVKHIRDDVWYFTDGTVVFLVEDKLFRVHGAIFARDSELFQALLSLPQGDAQRDEIGGHSDDNPIVCAGDSIEEFRALCWALYARPSDILLQQDYNTVDVPKLIKIVAISHKYDFAAYQDWALGVLGAHCSAYPTSFFAKCGTWSNVCTIFRLASQCNQNALVQEMEQSWLRRTSNASKSEGLTAFGYALDVAETSDSFRQFHGKLYYTYLQTTVMFCVRFQEGVESTGILDTASHIDTSLSKFSEERRYRILSGFWSLSRLWRKLSQPPKLENSHPPCTGNHTRDCVPKWQAWWKDALDEAMGQGRCENDPGKLIQAMQTRVRAEPLQLACASLVEKQIGLMKERFDDTLADHFLIPKQSSDSKTTADSSSNSELPRLSLI